VSVPEPFQKLAGTWSGTNRLHVPWMEPPVRESASTAVVSLKTQGKILCIEYTWVYDGAPQDGIMLISQDAKSTAVTMIYTDSWHLGHIFMECKGTADESGKIDIKGYYAVPDHPDWGWRTEIIPGDDAFRFNVYNVTPEGEEEIAVEGEFTRS
jgi:Protein of unknown function (DUF1579)